MADNIAMINGKNAFFCATDKHGLPWHKLGQCVQSAQSWSDAIKLAQMDWKVSVQPLFNASGEAVHFGVFRDDTNKFFAAVSEGYTPIQNAECFDFVDTLLNAHDGAHYESAGALGNGETVFCLARVPGADFTIAGADKHESYLLFANSHDGSKRGSCRLTTVRVVCQNTLNEALSRSTQNVLQFKHTKSVDVKMAEAKKVMSNVIMTANTLKDKLATLAKRKMTKDSFLAILDKVFPGTETSTRRKNTLESVTALFASNDGDAIPEIKGTAYAMLQAITNHTDHSRSVRLTDSRGNYTEGQARAENAVFGTGDALKQTALEIILQDTEGNPIVETKTVFAQPTTAFQPDMSSLLDSVLAQPIGN